MASNVYGMENAPYKRIYTHAAIPLHYKSID